MVYFKMETPKKHAFNFISIYQVKPVTLYCENRISSLVIF